MRWRSCCGGAVFGLLFCGVFLWWNFFAEVPLKIGPETTVLTEPRTPDGKYIDYAAYFRGRYPAQMQTEKNAARELVRLLGDLNRSGDAEAKARIRKQLYQGLGLDERLEPEFTLTHVREAFGNEEMDPTDPQLPRSDPARAQAWVEENSPALDAVTEVVQKAEICYFPLLFWKEGDSLFWAIQEPQANVWLVGRDLIFRANWRISQGDVEGAISDVLTCRKLGRMLRGNRLSAQELDWGLRMENEARRVPFAANPDAQPTAKQWQTLLDSFATTSCLEDCRTLLEEYELFAMLDLIQHDFLRKEKAELEWAPFLKSCLGRNWNVVFERFRKHWEFETEFYFTRNVPAKVKRDTAYMTVPGLVRLATRYLRSDWTAMIIQTQILMSTDTHWAVSNAQQYDHREKLARIGCAVRLYQSEHGGQLPPAVTTDATGKPLHTWRVLLLPYLGEKALFDQIRLEEPWDSAWNRQFHAQIPDMFDAAEEPRPAPGSTIWTWVADAKTGILISETETPHHWMEPDAPYEEPKSGGRWNILTTDGGVWYQNPCE
ncbi:MAG: DUF1559 domain-containing protein [Planctomycetia bacterium]|nr:DUF1559 domain-containing protein [Planctomycetia bacterium]